MPLLSLPNELLLLTAKHLGPKPLSALLLTTRALANLLTPLLHDLGAQETYTTSLTALYWAASNGRLALATALLSRGACVSEIAIPDHSTALHWAARSGSEPTTRLLLEHHMHCINAPDRIGDTPIFWASAQGHERIVRILAENGAHLENLRGQMLLHEAIGASRPAVAKALLETGADVHVYDQFGWLPLHCAARCGDEKTLLLLLDRRAGVDAVQLGSDATALHWAAAGGHAGAVRMLVGRGARVEARDDHGATPFHWAAFCGNAEAAEWLLRSGADINAVCKDGNTALHLALHDNDEAHDAVVKLLLERTSGPDLDAQNNAGATPLRWPVFSQFHNSVERMLRGGADMFAVDGDGRTVLDCAVERLDTEMIKTLVRFGTRGKRQAGSVSLRSFWRVVPRLMKEPFVDQRRREGAEAPWVAQPMHLPARPWLRIP